MRPQQWPEDLADKRIVVSGSGATVATLIRTIAETAAHLTMLQCSPRAGSVTATVTATRVDEPGRG